MPITVERPPMCALCLTTVARRGSLCHACADHMDERDKYEFPVDNAPTCSTCGGILEPNEFCGWCDAQETRRSNEFMVAHG